MFIGGEEVRENNKVRILKWIRPIGKMNRAHQAESNRQTEAGSKG